MIFLILAVCSSALVSIVLRCSENRIAHNMGMFAVNYAACLAVARFYSAGTPLYVNETGMMAALVMGLVSGCMYLINFVLLQWNIQNNGVVLSSTFMKLGVLVPTLMAVVLFHEIPGIGQVVGFLLAVSAIILINFEKGSKTSGNKWMLIVLLLVGGSTDSIAKVYEQYGNAALNDQYLFYTFLAALLIAFGMMLVKKQKIGVQELLFGILLGVPNYFSARFLLLALGEIPAIVTYPVYSVATIIVVTLTGILVFHEKPSKKQLYAIGIIIVSLVLLNS